MKFLVEAHLPPDLCTLLQKAGHDAIHTRQLSAKIWKSIRLWNWSTKHSELWFEPF